MERKIITSRGRVIHPLPPARVTYTPTGQTLCLEMGARKDGEEIADGVTVFYDENDAVVGIDIDRAEELLKPFIDAMLEHHARILPLPSDNACDGTATE